MNKTIHREVDVREKVRQAIQKVCMPVIETIGPLGKNVLYETDKGDFELTNDGITIARSIALKDPIENAVAEIIKGGALRTNQEAGDGTSTTILLSSVLLKETEELTASGMSHRAIRELYNRVLEKIFVRLDALKRTVKDRSTRLEIATISANNDKEVAKNTVDAIDTAGLDGMIYIEFSPNEKTTIEKQVGFRIAPGMVYQNLYSDVAAPRMLYQDVPVLLLDKTLYYAEEVEHIIRVAMEAGYKSIVVVAKGFQGDATNTFIANHVRGTISIALATLEDDIAIEDLAVYLDSSIVSEAAGRRTDSITKSDFVKAAKVTIDPQKFLLSNVKDSKALLSRIEGIKGELAKDKDNPKFKNRLASMTNGIVTIRVGGHTQTEAREKIYRYEDAINATRAAMRDGYLVGGGLALYHCYNSDDYDSSAEMDVAIAMSSASIERVAANAQIRLNYTKLTKNIGLNALTGEYEDLLKAGVVEPYKVTEMALKNAVSVATTLTSIGTFILNDVKEDDKDK